METIPTSPDELCCIGEALLQHLQLFAYYDTRSLPLEAADERKRALEVARRLAAALR